MRMQSLFRTYVVLLMCTAPVFAQESNANPNPQDCSKLPDHAKLKSALTAVVKEGQDRNGGLGNHGIVCMIVFTGPNRAAQWPGSRLISAEKASTANAFSTNNFALSTGNIYAGAQPGGSLYGIVTSPNPSVAFAGNPQEFGQQNDPMVGKPIGGVIVFGGGLPLYRKKVSSWVGSASAETQLAQITLSHGKLATRSDSTPFPWGLLPARVTI